MDKDELINGYFEGSLSEIQSAELERLRKNDVEFAAQFEFEKQLKSALKKDERHELKSMLSKLNTKTATDAEDRLTTNTETKVIALRPWLVAASVIFLLGIGSWLLFFNNPDLDAEQLYAANFVPYENVVHPIERGKQLEDLKTQAFTAYENQEYVSALALFEELKVQHADPYISFYEAIVLMQLEKHEKAIPLLKGYIDNDGQLKDRARWYLALAYLKMDEIENSKKELEILTKEKGFKAKASEKLLGELE